VLLLYGMSDSPYSLRSEGERLHVAGAYVIGLRIPGHGTAPSGLLRVSWQDMAAAVRLAMRHLRERVGDRPLHVVGFSNGAALAVHYALTALSDESLPRPDSLVLLSPAIGVTPFAALAIWQERIGHALGLEKLEWNSVGPEYDPFKYQSFAVNAGDLTYRLTIEIAEGLDEQRELGTLSRFPRVLAFQSAVDATVSTPALITGLFDRLPPGGHELVLFDVDRTAEIEYLLRDDPRPRLAALLEASTAGFTLTVVTNESDESRDVVAKTHRPGAKEVEVSPLGVAWPLDLFSLAHVALPFAPDDPLYGPGDGSEGPRVRIGGLALRGERGVLSVSADEMLRIRWNPFHEWMVGRMLEFTGLAPR
jgi:alpha-beta hydrolase superfamily lysophospholipase